MSAITEKRGSGTEALDKDIQVPKDAHMPYYYFPPSQRKVHDSDVTFEEYHYFALKTREEQKHLTSPKLLWRQWLEKKRNKGQHEGDHMADDKHDSSSDHGLTISDQEWTNASRAFRTAGWGAVFYLVSSLSPLKRNMPY